MFKHTRGMRRRRLALGGLLTASSLYLWLTVPVNVQAEVSNDGLNCRATIAGVDVATIDSEKAAQAVSVGQHSSVTVTMTADSPITDYTVELAFALRGWNVAGGSGNGSNTWSTTVKVDQYSRFGVGLYRVVAVSKGAHGSCTAAALVRVQGRPIPDTVGGDVAGALTVLSVLGIGGSAIKSAGGDTEGGDGGGSKDGGGGDSPPANEEIPTGLVPPTDNWCFPGFVLPVLMTLAFMVTGGGGPAGQRQGAQRLPRARWRPRIAGISILSGLLGAIAVVILFQEYAILFPTLQVLIAALVAGLLVGLVLPSLVRIIPVRRWNRRMAARERAVAATPPRPPA
jgi:hypothetical protein